MQVSYTLRTWQSLSHRTRTGSDSSKTGKFDLIDGSFVRLFSRFGLLSVSWSKSLSSVGATTIRVQIDVSRPSSSKLVKLLNPFSPFAYMRCVLILEILTYQNQVMQKHLHIVCSCCLFLSIKRSQVILNTLTLKLIINSQSRRG